MKMFDSPWFWLCVVLLNLPFALTGHWLNVLALAAASLALGQSIGERS